jgi:methionyl aminopeptidase
MSLIISECSLIGYSISICFNVAGITTNQLNDLCEKYTVDILDSESAPLNYKGYPKSICTSKNSVICHGIPDDIPLKEGDIINIDVTLKRKYDGIYHYGDSSRMYMIGKVHPRHRFLCEISHQCASLDSYRIEKQVPQELE